MVLPFFAITLFVSAFCLFLVQPIIGKLILPKLGGTPQVWNTCMVFFQTALLAGYGYTHTVSTRLKLRHQLVVHSLLLFLPLLVLLPNGPFTFPGWAPSLGDNPIPDTLVLLAKIVGIPFLVVATSAPLLQKWFAATGHAASKDPYFLYGASNLGSLLALLLYPVAVEPWFNLREQSWMFAGGYMGLMVLVLGCVGMVWQTSAKLVPIEEVPHPAPAETAVTSAAVAAPASTAVTTPPPAGPAPQAVKTATPAGPAPPPAKTSPAAATGIKKPKFGGKHPGKPGHAAPDVSIKTDEMTVTRRLRWICLAAVPSSFMLGVTSHITTDLSPIPLFWLIPLSLYLLSFILVYSRWPVVWVEKPHQYILYIQAFSIAAMIYCEVVLGRDPGSNALWTIVGFNVFAFFATALMCHGELAKDRPGTQHLTEYFLLMSVGGMVGGMFNGLVAPVFFNGLYEFPIAVLLACLVRPLMKEDGWLDVLLAGTLEPPHAAKAHAKGQKGAAAALPQEKPTSYAPLLDIALPLAVLALGFILTTYVFPGEARGRSGDISAARIIGFGLPLAICCFYFGRQIRFGLAIGSVLLLQVIYESRLEGGSYLVKDRSYFGIIRVKEARQEVDTPDKGKGLFEYTQLVHGHILHGQNFKIPADPKDRGNPNRDFSRLATTYYHRRGPAGVVMDEFNWFKDPPNYFRSDTRICASIIGVNALMDCGLPVGAIIDAWSEPPFATIGLGTGTMASYGRPFQYVHYYEIDNHIKRLSLPEAGDPQFGDDVPYFNYLFQAKKRGCNVEVLMGDARLRMAFPYMLMQVTMKNGQVLRGELMGDDGRTLFGLDPAAKDATVKLVDAQKKEHLLTRSEIESVKRDVKYAGGPDNFYHMMVVDAFSSDAIPAHLITKQALELYFTKLTEKGILCVHTSNRFVELPKVVAAVAAAKDAKGQEIGLGYAYTTGHDIDSDADKDFTVKNVGRSGSEWVMVARKSDYLAHLREPKGYTSRNNTPYWTNSLPQAEARYLWTDDHYNLLNIIRWESRR